MFEVDAYIGEEIFAKFFRFLDLLWLRARHVEVHGFVRLLAGAVLHEATTTPFDLHSASSLLLDVLDVGATLADDLSPQIETGDIFHIQENSLLWPFTLNHVSFDLSGPNLADSLCQTHLVRPVRVLSYGTSFRRQDWGVPAA